MSDEPEKPAQKKLENAEVLALNHQSEVPAERARAAQAVRKAQGEVDKNEDEWLELYGIDEDYARMVREMLGEGGDQSQKSFYTEDFDDDN